MKGARVMKYNFSNRIENMSPSLIREIDAYQNNNPNFISLADGNPAYESFPVDEIRKLNDQVYEKNSPEALLYGPYGGWQELADQVMDRLQQVKGITPDGNKIFMLGGAQMGLFLVPQMFCNEGDTVLTEEFSYAHAIDAIKLSGAKPVGLKMDDDGLNIQALETALKTLSNIKYLYLVPNFANPTGICLPIEKRKAIYDLACKFDILILEDDPYGDLRYEGKAIPPIKSLDKEGRVIYLSSFSKILASGLRVGYMCCADDIWANAYIAKGNLDAGTNITAQLIVSYYMKEYDLEEHILNVRKIYEKKWQRMKNVLERELPTSCKISKPEGGMFFWVTVPDNVDSEALFEDALKNGVGVVPSKVFAANSDNLGKSFRLCFSCSTKEQIEDGTSRFCAVVKKYCK